MPRSIPLLAAAIALGLAAPGTAQRESGGTLPGMRGLPDNSALKNNVVAENERFARNLDLLRDLRPRQRVTEYLAESERHRVRALELAGMARSGAAFPDDAAARIRDALRFDLETWRAAFQVSGSEWRTIRKEWLVEPVTLTAQEWAERRAAWFEERDAWITSRRGWASAELR